MSKRFPKDALNLRMNPFNHGCSFVTRRKSFRKFCECCDTDGLDQSVGRAIMCQCKGRTTFYFGVFDGEVDTLVHELAHIVFMLFDYVGVDARNDQGEAFAYMQGWLLGECMPKLKGDAKC